MPIRTKPITYLVMCKDRFIANRPFYLDDRVIRMIRRGEFFRDALLSYIQRVYDPEFKDCHLDNLMVFRIQPGAAVYIVESAEGGTALLKQSDFSKIEKTSDTPCPFLYYWFLAPPDFSSS